MSDQELSNSNEEDQIFDEAGNYNDDAESNEDDFDNDYDSESGILRERR